MAYTVSWSKEDSRHKTQKSCPQGAVIQCFAYKLLTVTMGHIHCGGGIVLNCVWPLPSHGLYPSRLLCPQDFPGKNTGVGCHALLQGTFVTQRLNLGLLHWYADSLPLKKPSLIIREKEIKITAEYTVTSVPFHTCQKDYHQKGYK